MNSPYHDPIDPRLADEIWEWTARQQANNRAYAERREFLESAKYENRWSKP